jgi:uncharacterized protein YndB with AHSA1/START domain
MTDQQTAVRIERTLPATPQQVYRAWMDPELARTWFSPAHRDATRVEIDPRVGGRYEVWHSAVEGDSGHVGGGMSGEILELVENERLVFDWQFVGPERELDPERETRLTIELRAAAPGTTLLTLVHERLDGFGAAMPDVAAGVTTGWGQAHDKLERAVAA